MAIAALNGLLQSHPNIHIVAQREAFYDQATARSIVQDILSKNTNIQVVVAAGDQMARGAEEAVAAAGPLPNRIEIIGGGASAYAVKAIRAGRWYGTFVTLPFDEGAYGVWMGIRAARHQSLLINGVDPVALRGLPAFMTADNLAAFQGFIPEWPG
jgi:ABC-type sugar transport system substrate-binding protein